MPNFNLLKKQSNKLKRKFYNEENIEFLSDSYYSKLLEKNNLEIDHITTILKEIIILILSCFEPAICKNNEEKLKMLNFLRAMQNTDLSVLQNVSNDNVIRLYFFMHGNEDLIESTFTKNNVSKEHASAYVDICRTIAVDQIEQITNTIFNSLSDSHMKDDKLSQPVLTEYSTRNIY